MTREGAFDPGPAPLEPLPEPAAEPASTETFQQKARRRWEEEQMRQQQTDLVKGWWMFENGDSGDAAETKLATVEECMPGAEQIQKCWKRWKLRPPIAGPISIGRIEGVTIRGGNVYVVADTGIHVWGADANVALVAGHRK